MYSLFLWDFGFGHFMNIKSKMLWHDEHRPIRQLREKL